MKVFMTLFILTTPILAASWDQLPLVPYLHTFDPNYVEKNLAELHPWKSGSPLPTDFKEAGLTEPVRLVACDIYLDGGSHYYLFRGANGQFLLLCTDPGSIGSVDAGKTIAVEKPRLFLGVSHFSEKNKVAVPYNSECERFLLAAIKSEVERINGLPMK